MPDQYSDLMCNIKLLHYATHSQDTRYLIDFLEDKDSYISKPKKYQAVVYELKKVNFSSLKANPLKAIQKLVQNIILS